MTVLHEFLLKFRGTTSFCYGFVEGKSDLGFYRTHIEPLLPMGKHLVAIRCKGKKPLLRSLAKFDWGRYPRASIAFFVDRDLSPVVDDIAVVDDNLFVTFGYSVENYCTNPPCFLRVAEELLGLEGLTANEQDLLVHIVEENLALFRTVLEPIMGQILLWRRSGTEINLNNAKPWRWFSFAGATAELKAEYADPEKRVHLFASELGVMPDSAGAVAKAAAELQAHGETFPFIRGKYELQFFGQCIDKIHEHLPSLVPRYASSPTRHISLLSGTACGIHIPPRSRCPDDLRAFVTRVFSA